MNNFPINTIQKKSFLKQMILPALRYHIEEMIPIQQMISYQKLKMKLVKEIIENM